VKRSEHTTNAPAAPTMATGTVVPSITPDGSTDILRSVGAIVIRQVTSCAVGLKPDEDVLSSSV